MVSTLSLLFAHGADPTPISGDEALANLVKLAVCFLFIAVMSYPALSPLLRPSKQTNTEEPTAHRDVVSWLGVALLIMLTVGWWTVRSSVVEMITEPAVLEDHTHTQVEGGQVTMWGDFHAEVVRVESGEVRIYLRDSFDRPIAARFYDVEIEPLLSDDGNQTDETPVTVETVSALNDRFRFARLDKSYENYRIKVSTPGWTTSLRFNFDGSRGRHSLPIWCAPSGR